MGPMVCELDGPTPILYRSKRLVVTDEIVVAQSGRRPGNREQEARTPACLISTRDAANALKGAESRSRILRQSFKTVHCLLFPAHFLLLNSCILSVMLFK